MCTPMIISEAEREALESLRERAAANPIYMPEVVKRLSEDDPTYRAAYLERMRLQTVFIPTRYSATFTIELGHPCGTCRHLSVSVRRKDRLPSQEAVLIIAEELGFVGGLESCVVWLETLKNDGLEQDDHPTQAVNIVQPVNLLPSSESLNS